MFLRNIWYFAMPSEALKSGQMVHKVLLGEPVVLGRTESGEVFALRDTCPHRGVPLSTGKLYSAHESGCGTNAIECPYHGWKFKPDGACAEIPSLVPGQEMEVARIRVRRYLLEEKSGNVWIFMSEKEEDQPTSNPPEIPGFAQGRPAIREQMIFSCPIDHAVIGLMDPAHGPFVHRSWWWRTMAVSFSRKLIFSRIRTAISGCCSTMLRSWGVSLLGLNRTASGIPILPMSWIIAARRITSSCFGPTFIALAIATA